MKKIITLIIVILVAIGGYFLIKNFSNKTDGTGNPDATVSPSPTESITPAVVTDKSKTVIGSSVEGREILAYHFGTGNTEILFIGGIHGGYEWNTTLLAYELIDYLKENPDTIPNNALNKLKVTVIPTLNPDGLYKVTGTTENFSKADVNSSQETQIAGRFNANEVDLNRNFDCDWKKEGKWQNKTVSGGNNAFSEAESQAIKNYIEKSRPTAVIVWYSAAGGVFASSCHNGVLPETIALTDIYAKASGYPSHESFNFYEITGDMVNWLAKKNIPAISVLLTNHTDTEWTKNLKGVQAVLSQYGAQ